MRGQGRLADVIGGLICIVFFAGVFAAARALPPARTTELGPAFFPTAVAVAGLALGAVISLRAVHRGRRTAQALSAARDDAPHPLTWQAAGLLALTVTFVLSVDAVGFVPTSFVFLLASMKLLGERRPLALLLYPAGLTVAVYYLFGVWLNVRLPMGALG